MLYKSIFNYYTANAPLGDKLGPFIDTIGFDVFLKDTMEIYNNMRATNS